jgi:hypothetical protein
MSGFAFEGRRWLWGCGEKGQRTELMNALVRRLRRGAGGRSNAAPPVPGRLGLAKTRLTRKPICLYSTQRYHTNESGHDEVKVNDIPYPGSQTMGVKKYKWR